MPLNKGFLLFYAIIYLDFNTKFATINSPKRLILEGFRGFFLFRQKLIVKMLCHVENFSELCTRFKKRIAQVLIKNFSPTASRSSRIT